ncbi:hypothetical protein PSACC_00632 [Paramicrosporidium saccamoebae]|uniref:Uncharacterized protein n=1 Tax=Paramicrosporidium saccamoebae TaxID=1246581 RepID=A0A2H9TP92_9FUNG|nr:hypothetical protein PSACC_00632 [Paramicrosporidium saccamoebae]
MVELVNSIPEAFQRVPSQAEVTREWREAIAAQVHFATEEKLRYVLATVAVRADLDTGLDAGLDVNESVHKDEVQSFFEKTNRLFLSSTRLVLVNPEGSSITIAYPSIILHSVIATPPEVYCQLDLTDLRLGGRSIELGEDAFLELHLGVDDPIELYEALCECACLHPGIDESESEGEGESESGGEDDEDRPSKLACYDDAEK